MKPGRGGWGDVRDWAAHRLPGIYLVVALTISLTLCVLTPPFFAPDEMNHALREIELSRGELIARRSGKDIGAEIDTNALRVMQGFGGIQAELMVRYPKASTRPDGRISEVDLSRLRGVRWAGSETFASFGNTAVYPPSLYVPQAIGWRLGRAADLSIVRTLLLARVLAALCAVTLGWLSLRLCAGARWLLFAYFLLPTVLGLEGSASQDALLFPVSGLAVALLSRAIAARRTMTSWELAGLAGSLAVLIGARIPYLPLVAVLLLPSLNLGSVTLRKLTQPLLGILFVLAVCGAWLSAVHTFGNATGPMADDKAQVVFLREHPLRGLANLTRGSIREIPGLVVKGLETLGSGDVFPPAAVYGLLGLGAAGLFWLGPPDGVETWRARLLLASALAGVVVAISLAEYLIWTPPGSDRVLGLQARYYLPLLPLAGLGSRRRRREGYASEEGRSAPLALACILMLTGVVSTPWVAAHRFYGMGLPSAFVEAVH